MADKQAEFERRLAIAQAKGRRVRLDGAPLIGVGPDGQLLIYPPGEVPGYEPTIIYGDERDEPDEPDDDDPGDLSDLSDLDGIFGGGAEDAATWREGDHPRGQPGNAGQFGSGGGSSKPAEPKHETRGSPIATEWAQKGKEAGLTSKFAGGESPVVYHGLKPGHAAEGHLFVTRSKAGAEFHGKATAYRLKPGAEIHADIETNMKRTGKQTLLDAKEGDSSGIIHRADLEAVYSAGVKASGLADAVAEKTAWRAGAPATVEELLAGAPKNQARLAEVCDAIAGKAGLHFKNPGPKKPERIQEKLDRGKTPQQVNDAVRGGFDARTPEEADAIVAGLAEHFEVADEGWARTPAGYVDRKVMVRFDDGMVGEVQVWPPGMLAAKSGEGHKIYQEWQNLPADSPRKGEMQDRMAAVFAAVVVALPGAWHQVFS